MQWRNNSPFVKWCSRYSMDENAIHQNILNAVFKFAKNGIRKYRNDFFSIEIKSDTGNVFKDGETPIRVITGYLAPQVHGVYSFELRIILSSLNSLSQCSWIMDKWVETPNIVFERYPEKEEETGMEESMDREVMRPGGKVNTLQEECQIRQHVTNLLAKNGPTDIVLVREFIAMNFNFPMTPVERTIGLMVQDKSVKYKRDDHPGVLFLPQQPENCLEARQESQMNSRRRFVQLNQHTVWDRVGNEMLTMQQFINRANDIINREEHIE